MGYTDLKYDRLENCFPFLISTSQHEKKEV